MTARFIQIKQVKLALLALLIFAFGASCSFVHFERSPMTPRGLVVVYSVQEDLTFLSWKMGEDADLVEMRFELFIDGAYRPIDLADAPYPAEPYACGSDEICVQYQIPGRLDLSPTHSAVRAVGEHLGEEQVWGGAVVGLRVVDETFGIEPFAVDNNRTIDPGLFDWFAENEVELRRDFQFQFVAREQESPALPFEKACGEIAAEAWRPMGAPTRVDHSWVDSPVCFAASPKRRDEAGAVLVEPLRPSAETVFERQVYEPQRQRAPIIYGVLFDLEIANAGRCAYIKERLGEMISTAINERGQAEALGPYLPISAQSGEPIDNCHQESGRYCPVATMLHDAEVKAAAHDPLGVRAVWIYVNNSNLPPDETLFSQLGELLFMAPEQPTEPPTEEPGVPPTEPPPEPPTEQPHSNIFAWAIGSNAILSSLPWHAEVGWRPIDDETFEADITSVSHNALPFLNMLHIESTEVPITRPAEARDPRYFKICTAQPHYLAIGNRPGEPPTYGATSAAPAWPQQTESLPFYTVDLGEQRLVPFRDYRHTRVEIVVEVCERFCDHPFRSRGGVEYSSWIDPQVARPMEACQWSR
jgi:hypothetical protein